MTRLQQMRARQDEGAMLVLVMLVSMIVLLLTATVASSTTGQIVPAKKSQDDAIAVAAAQGGLDDFSAAVNSHCLSAGYCAWVLSDPHVSQTPIAAGSTTTFSWRLLNASSYVRDNYLRVVSTGRTAAPNSRSKTLIGDFHSVNGFFDYVYYSQFETVGSTLINARFPARTIVLDNSSAISAAGQSGSSATAAWNVPPATGVGSPTTCDRYYYNDAVVGTGRHDIGKVNGADWDQTGVVGGTSYINYGQCEVTFGSDASFNGPVASRDAMLLSKTTLGGSGPTFLSRVDTYWGNADANSPLAPTPNTYRSQVIVGGSPSAASTTNVPTTTGTVPSLPVSISDAPTSNRCTYVGPTRVKLLGDGTALITSPQSTGVAPATDMASCRTNTDATLTGSGVVSAVIPMAHTTIYVQNNPVALSPATPIFKKSRLVSASLPASTVSQSDPTWTGSPQAAWVTSVKNAVTGASHTDVATAVTAALPANPASPSSGAVRYQVRETSTDMGTSTTPGTPAAVSAPSSDPLLEPTAGYTRADASNHAVKYVAHVDSETAQCTLLNILGVCIGSWVWPASWTPDTYTATTTRTDTTYVDASVAATATFPLSNDVTQYSPKNGDVYIEGTQVGASSIAAEGDIVVSGALTYGTNGTDAIDLVALNSVRVYHPVKCTDTTATSLAGTTAGFCPNDITGLYTNTNVPAWSIHPSQQYTDIRSDLANLPISAGVFALGGSFYTDNYDRGVETNGVISLRGGVYQLHRGALGEQWEILSNASGSRHHTGYGVSFIYDATLGTDARGLPYRPSPAGATPSHVWSMQSISTSDTLSAS